ncbi:zinc knuckle domain-containing protein [Hirsutella rhossiliensis]|uniref:Zinc knuckle domain-containing protein n=1 Tax=Hirsutella rhossiliensis TaxID=111463 RepID=A0A9P8MYZ5_9HYPO|nr:zinc knuckle domain-containing protein [Hirsutella rhossiliensis]KAH0963840.1 zinc knuckle domain-containing protein [Hirsutella rhossiliensis]
MRSTPANVQCQKCLKRDMFVAIPIVNLELIPSLRHYSYECKAPAQERPYASRPSRSQQLRNPKLVPKLTNDAFQPLEKKKGVADEEIAKRETERAQKRERENREDEMINLNYLNRRLSRVETVKRADEVSNALQPQLQPQPATSQRPPAPLIAAQSFSSTRQLGAVPR